MHSGGGGRLGLVTFLVIIAKVGLTHYILLCSYVLDSKLQHLDQSYLRWNRSLSILRI